MKTRQDYISNKCSHEEYYVQFVDNSVKKDIQRNIGLAQLKRSKDEHMNDIPLIKWDMCYLSTGYSVRKLKEAGDYLTDAGKVCILKEAARQLLEGNKVKKESD
ncbi:MAG: hypothetical protein KKB37_17065 [Alphaproteobacteria bacterium]|nr:hypothetical protein [Alphaproteobacteria bacterium]